MGGPPQTFFEREEKGRVFCEKCKHLIWKGHYRCRHPNNIKHKKTWYSESVEFKEYRKPHRINKRNNCRLFELDNMAGGKKLL
jgi:hypothetical protein